MADKLETEAKTAATLVKKGSAVSSAQITYPIVLIELMLK